VDTLGDSGHHIGSLDEVNDKEETDQRKDNLSDTSLDLLALHAARVVAWRSIFSQTTSFAAVADTSKESPSLADSLTFIIVGETNAVGLSNGWGEERFLDVVCVTWEWSILGHY